GNNGERGRVTDATGDWEILGLPTGKEFLLRWDAELLAKQTAPAGGDGIHITPQPGIFMAGRNFGLNLTSMWGQVFNDVNGNGTRDASETPVNGRTVWIDLDNDKIVDANEPSTTTSGASFAFAGLTPGTNKLRQVLPAGWSQTTPANGYGISVALAANQSVGGKLFGAKQIAPAGASISGTVFWDLNGNTIKDAGEGGLAGRTIWIDLDNDKILD